MHQPPTGTVTFLFTDIEGSTSLWEQHPDAMRSALARHDQILHQAITKNGGHVFKTVGDAFCAAFATAPEAVQAALVAQVALDSETWETATPLRVRMALHTGNAEARDGDYFGPPMNRVARLLSTGHGGQILLSLATQELARDQMPASMRLLDLGPHRLKDLIRPETVFQLQHLALPAEFPPLKSLDNPSLPNNLPQQATSFIGREKEVTAIKALLSNSRLLTLVGAGGSGKTRLALQAAADLLNGDGDGVWLIELAPMSDSALVPQAVADVLGVREEVGESILWTLKEWLKPKNLLLILDNCEHLVAACAALAAELLRYCPGVHILASSREPLNAAGEQTYRVPSLSLPDPKQAQTVETLSQYEAVRLFIERAQAVQPTFTVTDANAPAVAQVCFHLDGIPLALELAAARVRSLTVEEVNAHLDHRFRLLTGGSRTALPRQQTLRALIDWSYDLLTEQEKTLLCRLSVFMGGWTLAAAESVCAGEDLENFEVLDVLTSLADKSLVVTEALEEQTRYRLLETMRQYGMDRLVAGGEREAAQGRHVAWFLALAEQADPQFAGPEQATWLARLETEHDNLRVALAWCEHQPAEVGLRLAGTLWRFWQIRGHFSEGRQWLGRALERSAQAETSGSSACEARAKTLNGAGVLAYCQGEYDLAQVFWAECLALARQLGNQIGIANALNNLGHIAVDQGKYNLAQVLLDESLMLLRQLGNQSGIAVALSNLGNLAVAQGEYASACALLEECLVLDRQLGNQNGIAASLSNLGEVACTQGKYDLAQVLLDESLMLLRQLGNQSGIAVALSNLGNLAVAQGEYASARALLEESLALRRQLGNQNGMAYGLEEIASVAQRQNQPRRAVELLGAADALREAIGAPVTPIEREERNKELSTLRAELGDDTFTAAWNAGRAMTVEQAVKYALSEE